MTTGDVFWKAISVLWFSRRFGSFGQRTWIRRPMMITNCRQIHIGSQCMIRDDARLEVVNRDGQEPGSIVIGSDVTIEQGAHVVAGSRVEIGDHSGLSRGVTIIDTSHPMTSQPGKNRVRDVEPGWTPITIGKHVFIGANAVVLPGVSIGDYAVIGAGSIVTRDIPPLAVAVGAPARVIRFVDPPSLSAT